MAYRSTGKLKNLLLAVSLLLSAASFSQTDESHPEFEAVLATVHAWAKTLETGDLERRAELTIDAVVVQMMVQQDDGSYELQLRTRDNTARGGNQSVMVERFWDEKVFIDGVMAVYWASYDFWIDGRFSHCGSDAFNLAKVDGQWKIGSMMYTRQRIDCPPSPLGEL